MREVDRVANLLAQTYHGDAAGLAWFGPALRPLLGAASPATATHRPLQRRHTIWELVMHLTANIDFVLARLDGTELELSANADWPPVLEPTRGCLGGCVGCARCAVRNARGGVWAHWAMRN